MTTRAPSARSSPRSPAPAIAGARRGRRRRRGRLTPYLFIAPFFVIFAAFGVYPLLYAARLSFYRWHGTGTATWVGWGNYTYLLTNSEFWASLQNSAVIWVLVVPVQMILGLALAVALANAKLRLKSVYRLAFIVPFVTPLVAMAQIWVVLFDTDFGLINHVLGLVGIGHVGWLTTTTWSKPTLALLLLWKTTGFAVILMLAGLQAVPGHVYEAARIDGASGARAFWSITVPLMRRTIAFVVVVQTLAVFQLFAEPYVVTKGGPFGSSETAGLYLYDHVTASDLGTGAANSFLLVILVFLLSLLAVWLLRAKD